LGVYILDSLNLNILNRASLLKNIRDVVRLTEEAIVVVCPNPRCQREVEEPLLLTILSVTPPKQYEACPYCFAKLEQEAPIMQKPVSEPAIIPEEATEPKEKEEISNNLSVNAVLEKVKDSGPNFFKKVKALIPNTNGLKKEKKEKTKEPEAEPAVKKEEAPKEKPKTEPAIKKEEQKPEPSANKEATSSGCPQAFGYLANRPKDMPIPQGCLVCPKMVDCMLSSRNDQTT
jgi:hypothetical protein